MITKYFSDFDKKISKKPAAKKEGGRAEQIRELLAPLIPAPLVVDTVRPVDSEAFSPEGADLVAYREYCKDIVKLMNGYIPYELIHGLFFIQENLERKSLVESLNKVAMAKKLNFFTGEPEEEQHSTIPSFIIAIDSGYGFLELKNDIINYYLANSTPPAHEVEIVMIIGKGVVIKNWREKRSYIAIETGDDTWMWFFVLMSEYLQIGKETELDFRKYVKKDVVYTEY